MSVMRDDNPLDHAVTAARPAPHVCCDNCEGVDPMSCINAPAARPDAPDLDHLDALAERLRDLTYRGRNMTGPEAATYARYLLPVVQQLAARERDRLRDAVLALTYASDDGTEWMHNGHDHEEGEPECPGCWAANLRAVVTDTTGSQQ